MCFVTGHAKCWQKPLKYPNKTLFLMTFFTRGAVLTGAYHHGALYFCVNSLVVIHARRGGALKNACRLQTSRLHRIHLALEGVEARRLRAANANMGEAAFDQRLGHLEVSELGGAHF